MATRALEDVTILDFSHLLQGPFATQLLAGDPVAAVLAAVHREHADLVALTTAGNGDSSARAAEEILKRCDRPLLVLHTGRIS